MVVDECHIMRKATTRMVMARDGWTLGLSATPFTKGMGDVYTNVVNAVTTDRLHE